MRCIALLALLAHLGCGPARRLVVQDGPRTGEFLDALARLEAQAGCSLFDTPSFGEDSDWEGRLPPFGTTTLEAVEAGSPHLPSGKIGYAAYGGGPPWRCRAYVAPECGSACIQHELLHCLGYHHVADGGLRDPRPRQGETNLDGICD